MPLTSLWLDITNAVKFELQDWVLQIPGEGIPIVPPWPQTPPGILSDSYSSFMMSHLSQPKILNFSILQPHRAKIRCQSFWKSNSTYYERLTQFGPIQTILGRFCITLIQYQDIVVNFTSKEWTQGPPGGNLFALWWPPAPIRSMRCAASALLLGVRKWSNILTKYILAILLLWWSSPWLAINQKFLVRCTKIDKKIKFWGLFVVRRP